MQNYFRGSVENPYHISIGGLTFNDEGKILVHHFHNKTFCNFHFKDLYILLRETIEPNESIEQTLARGLMEEFGATGELVKYLGSIKGKYPIKDIWVDKTTLYFLIKYVGHDNMKRQQGTSESESALEWIEPKILITHMQKQSSIDASLDESVIVERFLGLGVQ